MDRCVIQNFEAIAFQEGLDLIHPGRSGHQILLGKFGLFGTQSLIFGILSFQCIEFCAHLIGTQACDFLFDSMCF